MKPPYLHLSSKYPGAASLLIKKAAEKNAEIMRQKTVEEHREMIQALADVRIIPPQVETEQVIIKGIPCEWIFTEESLPDRVILYIHGGSWAFGNCKTARAAGVLISEASGCRVLVPEYRLSPEHPYPAGLDDCDKIFQFLIQSGYPPHKIALFGDSAGGNLSLALLHRLKQRGEEMPAALAMASPVTDLTDAGPIVVLKPNLLYTIWQERSCDIVALYTGEHDRGDPLLSPIYGELEGFPPMLIHVGEEEELCEDNLRFAKKAFQSGVDVTCKVWKGMFHDFSVVGITLKESRESVREIGEFFKEHLHVEKA